MKYINTCLPKHERNIATLKKSASVFSKNCLYFILLFFCFFFSFGQQNEIQVLEKKFEYYKYTQLYDEYDAVKATIIKGLENNDLIEKSANELLELIKYDKAIAKVATQNNPTTNQFRYGNENLNLFDIIERKTTEILTKGLNDKEKKRAKNIFKNIIDTTRDLVVNFVNTNPIVNAITSLIAIGSSHTFYTFDDRNGKYQNKKIMTPNVESFRKELQPYVIFYKDLSGVNNKYQNAIDSFKENNQYLLVRNRDVDKALLDLLEIRLEPNGDSRTLLFQKKYLNDIKSREKDIDKIGIEDIKLQMEYINDFLDNEVIVKAKELLEKDVYIDFRKDREGIKKKYTTIKNTYIEDSKRIHTKYFNEKQKNTNDNDNIILLKFEDPR